MRTPHDARTFHDALATVLSCATELDSWEHLTPAERLLYSTEIDFNIRKVQREAVHACRAAGESWETIGALLGITRQSAWERYSVETG